MTTTITRTLILAAALLASIYTRTAAQTQPFWYGADISGATEQEARGWKLYNEQGQERECVQLMHELGFNAVRLRVWVNPKDSLCSPTDMLKLALRAKEYGMPVMVDFHYADSWADPAKQPIPEAWQGLKYKDLRKAFYQHTLSTLQMLRDHQVDVRWVQVGNETTHGFLWDVARAETNMKNYADLTRLGYKAVKNVYPQAQVIVHLDAAADSERYNFIFDNLKRHHTPYDIIGMSVYPYWDIKAGITTSWPETVRKMTLNIKRVALKYRKHVIITETGTESAYPEEGQKIMQAIITAARDSTNQLCNGVFYWAPESEGAYPLGAFHNHRPTQILKAFTTEANRYKKW